MRRRLVAEPRPDAAAERDEMREWLLLGLEMLEEEDQQVLRMRQFKGLPFDQVAERLCLQGPDAARMRFNRALPKLARRIEELKAGQVESPRA